MEFIRFAGTINTHEEKKVAKATVNVILENCTGTDVLREEGKLLEAERTLRWYAITNEVYPKPEGNGIDMDSFNTQTTGRIASILMMEDTPEKLQYLKSFSRWIDYGCRPAPGLAGSFKVDGGAFHHRNNYPAYAVGGTGRGNKYDISFQSDKPCRFRIGTPDGQRCLACHAFLLQ